MANINMKSLLKNQNEIYSISSQEESVYIYSKNDIIIKEVYFNPLIKNKDYIFAFKAFLEFHKKNNFPFLVKIFDYEFDLPNNYYKYSIEKLDKLSKSEYNLVDDYYYNYCSTYKLFINEKLNNLINFLEDNKKYYSDIHSGNVMKANKLYKFIDLEGVNFFVKNNVLYIGDIEIKEFYE